jgi:para-nitrobenzyl esterase
LVEFQFVGGIEGDHAVKKFRAILCISVACAFTVFAAFFTLSLGAATTNGALIVHTAAGQIRGAARSGGGAEFLGIPYGQPPVGSLRWHEPLPAKAWEGVRDAVKFSAPCAQPVLGDWNHHDADISQEDCLYLNVITPAWPAKGKLPVMFWIHGGANMGGTAMSDLYNRGTLASHGVVLVAVNYRLGVFGFLAHPALTQESAHHASGNYGLADQVIALHWVIDNIAKFGGDPENITVFGQSAGAQDTGILMASSAKDLFQKAIAESGTSFSPRLPRLAEAESQGVEFAANLKAPAGDGAIAFLRQISAKDLLQKIADLPPAQRPPLGPDVDGWVVPRSPTMIFATGQEAGIPLMFGTTTREFGSEATADQLRARMDELAGTRAAEGLAVYGLANGGLGTTDSKYGTAADQMAADAGFRCPATTQGGWHSAAHHPTFEYEFAHAIPGQETQGAVHSSDLPYVFGFFPKEGNISGAFGDVDTKLADLMQIYWTNFAKTGNPNDGKAPNWPEFDGTQAYLVFGQDGHVATAAALRKPQCDFYREVLADRIKMAH